MTSIGSETNIPFIIVFDTCTQPKYYGDLHQLLALPVGSILRYEYKRRLFHPDAFSCVNALKRETRRELADVLLMYGQKNGFQRNEPDENGGAKDHPDPRQMLRLEDSIFVPTRTAKLVNVKTSDDPGDDEDVVNLHLELRGFVDPDSPQIEMLVRGLEARDSLPFGDSDRQKKWVALLPEVMQADAPLLRSEDNGNWRKVVNRLVTAPTQFENDVFWRVKAISEQTTHGDRLSVVRVFRTEGRLI